MYRPISRRTLPVILAVAAASFLSGCDSITSPFNVDNTNFAAEVGFSFTVAVTSQTVFRLEGINGGMEMVGVTDGDEVLIEGVRRVESESRSDASAHLDDLQVLITSSASEVRARTSQPNNTGGRNYTVEYEIWLPRGMEARVTNVNGGIVIDGLRSALTLNNTNGQVVLIDHQGDVRVDVVNGEIEAEVTLDPAGTADLGTVNGAIELWIPENTSAGLDASVANGSISVDNLDLQDVVSTNTSLSGTLGDGLGTVRVSTVNGAIRIFGF